MRITIQQLFIYIAIATILTSLFAQAGSLTLEEFTIQPVKEQSVSMKVGEEFEVGIKVKAVDTWRNHLRNTYN